jgi:hypothetical protein
VFVLQCDHLFTREQREEFLRIWRATMGDAKVLVLERGVRLGVVAPTP